MKIRYAGSTHVGMKRGHNEDNFYLLPEHNIYMVADGMGGHASGEVASQIAVESIANFFIDTAKDSEITWPYKEDKSRSYDENRLANSIKLANRRIFETAKSDAKYRGMGTTVVAMMVAKDSAMIGHVGDSRAYRVRDGEIIQVTEDHSLLNDYLKVHKLTPEEIEAFPHKNVIVRALGMKDTVMVDINHLDPKPGDKYIICSDGLSGMINDETICNTVVQAGDDLEKCCADLIQGANDNGGQDNITVVVVHFAAD